MVFSPVYFSIENPVLPLDCMLNIPEAEPGFFTFFNSILSAYVQPDIANKP